MNKFIIYPQENNSVAIIYPAPECGLTVEEIALKDVPTGIPYMIINSNELPENDEFFEAWEADFSQPDGYGMGYEAWKAMKDAQNQPPAPMYPEPEVEEAGIIEEQEAPTSNVGIPVGPHPDNQQSEE